MAIHFYSLCITIILYMYSYGINNETEVSYEY